MEPFSDAYVPREFNKEFPQLISDFRDTSYINLPYAELLMKCKEIKNDLKVSKNQSAFAEKETREQSKNDKWFKLRCGRITASRLRAVLHTNPSKPSKSLIKQICYPEAFRFSSKATCWGCDHEKKSSTVICQSNVFKG